MNVASVLLDDVVHGRRVPGRGFRILLFGKVNAECVVARRLTALRVHVPAVGVIAAANDAVVADDVVLLGVRRNDGELTDMPFVSHLAPPQSTLDRRP